LARQVIPALRQSRGYIIIMGSHSAAHFFEGGVAYCATKAALKAICEVLILENRGYGIRTTLVNAGAIRNRPINNDDRKILPETIARIIYDLVHSSSDSIVRVVEIRPTNPLYATVH